MKTFCVAVAVAVVLTFTCIKESSAVPVTEVDGLDGLEGLDGLDGPVSNDNSVAAHDDMSDDLRKMPYNRQKPNPAGCRVCCNCCPGMVGCGLCCRF